MITVLDKEAAVSTPRPRPTTARPALVADMFCGAGGSSTGARRAMDALGLRMVLTCVNHWPLAIETHQMNHPEARHYCQDVASLRPVEAVPEGYLDLLMASPTCTYHSRARGGKPTSDQQRQDPWHVVTWLTELRVKRLLVENVPEFVEWGPVNVRTGKPIRSRKGEYFLAWVGVIRALGYRVEWRLLNAADFGDATTRQRFFLIARSDGKAIRWPEPSHCRGGVSTMFGTLKPWRAAREVIDWTIAGRSIFDRKRPLAPKTIARILAGAQKFRWPEPFLVILRNNATASSIDGPLKTISAGGGHHGLAQPMAIPFVLSQGGGGVARDVVEPLPTIVGAGAISMVEPLLVTVTGGAKPKAPRSVDGPLGTITTKNGVGVAEPMLSPYYGASASCVSVDSPVPTVTTKSRFGVVEPVAEPFVCANRSNNAPKGMDEPVPPFTTSTGGGCFIAEPVVVSTRHSKAGAGPQPRSTDDPLPTIVATDSRFGIAEPVLVSVAHSGWNSRARSVEEPLPTIVATDREFAIAEPFMVPHFGERIGQAPRVHSLDEPLPTITSRGAAELVEATVTPAEAEALRRAAEQGRLVSIDGMLHVLDIRFRMLEPSELARASGFSDQEAEYEFAGNKTDITRQIGNAVPVNMARALVTALFTEASA